MVIRLVLTACASVWLCACADLNLGCIFRDEITAVGGSPERFAAAPSFVSVLHEVLTPFGFQGPSELSSGRAYFSLGVGSFSPKERIDIQYDPVSKHLWLTDYHVNGGSSPSKYDQRILDSLREKMASAYGASLEIRPINEAVCFGP
jgi:hypothetical protein